MSTSPAVPVVSEADQDKVVALLTHVMPLLKPETQALVGVATALQMPGSNNLHRTFDIINSLTKAASLIPNPEVQTATLIASIIEQIVEGQVNAIQAAQTASGQQHVSPFFRFLHHRSIVEPTPKPA